VAAGVGFGEFADIARGAFVNAVANELQASGERVTRSAIAAATGLTRQDVARYLGRSLPSDVPRRRLTRAQRLADAWRTDAKLRGGALWLDRRGVGPREPSFSALVRRAGGDVPPRAMERELVRSGLARVSADGRISLRTRESRGETRAVEALRSAAPWLRAVTVPAANSTLQRHASLRWAETHWASERELLAALEKVLHRRDRLLGQRAKRPDRKASQPGKLAVGVAVIATLKASDSRPKA
jgi:hypothetical protein